MDPDQIRIGISRGILVVRQVCHVLRRAWLGQQLRDGRCSTDYIVLFWLRKFVEVNYGSLNFRFEFSGHVVWPQISQGLSSCWFLELKTTFRPRISTFEISCLGLSNWFCRYLWLEEGAIDIIERDEPGED
jgi:hypothetical protein